MESLNSLRSMDRYHDVIILYNRCDKWPEEETLNLRCTYCLKVLVDAVQTTCGCRYCRRCLTRMIQTSPSESVVHCVGESDDCKTSVINLNNLIDDTAINRDIIALNVPCLYHPLCNFRAILRDMKPHLADCVFRQIPCDKCREQIQFTQRNIHESLECRKRDFTCPNCQDIMSLDDYERFHCPTKSNIINSNDDNINNSIFLDNIDKLCENFETLCWRGCGETVLMKSHLTSCKKYVNKCVFCEFKGSPNELSIHMIEKGQSHFQEMKNKIEALETTNLVLNDRLGDIEAKYIHLTDKYQDMKRIFTEYSRKSLVSSKPVSYGSYIWKIQSWKEVSLNARNNVAASSLISDAFYSSEFGYKLCLKIYPCGDGSGLDKYLSVYFTLCKGEYDEMLIWPFRNKVVLSLINPYAVNIRQQIAKSDTFRPDNNDLCYSQPKEAYNVASGSPKFIPIDELEKYIKNDTLFLKVEVLNL